MSRQKRGKARHIEMYCPGCRTLLEIEVHQYKSPGTEKEVEVRVEPMRICHNCRLKLRFVVKGEEAITEESLDKKEK